AEYCEDRVATGDHEGRGREGRACARPRRVALGRPGVDPPAVLPRRAHGAPGADEGEVWTGGRSGEGAGRLEREVLLGDGVVGARAALGAGEPRGVEAAGAVHGEGRTGVGAAVEAPAVGVDAGGGGERDAAVVGTGDGDVADRRAVVLAVDVAPGDVDGAAWARGEGRPAALTR